MSVLVVDAGQDRTRQLAGELLHPSGVEDLKSLGFADVLESLKPHEVTGFAVIDLPGEDVRECLLPYPEGDRGLSLEHSELVSPLFQALKSRAGIAVLPGSRLTQLLRNDAAGAAVVITNSFGQETRVGTRLLVGADGRSSQVRKMLGICETHERISTMVGVVVDAAELPHKSHGHLFIGGRAPVLGYATGGGKARVMVDLPLGSRPALILAQPQLLAGLPEGLREGVLAALRAELPRVASNDTRLPATTVVNSAVLVGDAAGCCHPLSASGMASGIRDARELQRFLGRRDKPIPVALERYARARRPAQRTRIALASALYRAFADRGEQMGALRSGLFRYWEHSDKGSATSMLLLSGRESRMWVMAREFARVVGHGMAELASEVRPFEGRSLTWAARAGTGLVASAWPHLQMAAVGAVRDWEARL